LTKTTKGDIMPVVEYNPFGEIQEITHDQDCWRYHGLCAIKKLTDLNMLLAISKKKIDRDEIIAILKG
jgi:hypothetical protein